MSDESAEFSGRARPGDEFVRMVPQPHGGALRVGGNTRSSWKAARKQALAMMREMTPMAVDKLRLLVNSPDDRVAVVAIKELLDRVYGKAGEALEAQEDAREIDLSHLTAEQRAQVAAALALVRPSGPVIDAE